MSVLQGMWAITSDEKGVIDFEIASFYDSGEACVGGYSGIIFIVYGGDAGGRREVAVLGLDSLVRGVYIIAGWEDLREGSYVVVA